MGYTDRKEYFAKYRKEHKAQRKTYMHKWRKEQQEKQSTDQIKDRIIGEQPNAN